MKTVVYARADKVPEDCDYITEGKLYPVNESGDAFEIKCDDGIVIVAHWHGSHGVTWIRIGYPYRDPKAVEDGINALQKVAENCRYHRNAHLTSTQLMEMLITIVEPALARLEGGEA